MALDVADNAAMNVAAAAAVDKGKVAGAKISGIIAAPHVVCDAGS